MFVETHLAGAGRPSTDRSFLVSFCSLFEGEKSKKFMRDYRRRRVMLRRAFG